MNPKKVGLSLYGRHAINRRLEARFKAAAPRPPGGSVFISNSATPHQRTSRIRLIKGGRSGDSGLSKSMMVRGIKHEVESVSDSQAGDVLS